MADYPGSVFSPATISNGATIDASHQNEPNDEITAIQDALVNGNIAHDVTPSSSAERSLGEPTKRWSSIYVDAIQSTGNSTLGNVTVGNLTVTNLQVNGGSSGVVVTTKDHARISNSADIPISSGKSALNFNNVRWESNSSMFSTASSVVTIQSSGVYLLQGQMKFASTGSQIAAEILLNSTTIIARVSNVHNASGGANVNSTRMALNVETSYKLEVGNTVSLRADAGLTTNTIRALSNYSPEFTITQLT